MIACTTLKDSIETLRINYVRVIHTQKLTYFRRTVSMSKPPRTDNDWSAEQLDLLGTRPDLEIAERIGKSENAVYCKRKAFGIPAYKQNASLNT